MFYDNLKRICKENGVGITKLVETSGVSTGNISNWKSGKYPNSEVVIILAKALNCSTDALLLGEDRKIMKLSDKELELLALYKCLSPEEQSVLYDKALDLFKSSYNLG